MFWVQSSPVLCLNSVSMFRIPLIAALTFVSGSIFSNAILFENLVVRGYDPLAYTVQVSFDVQWENSWRITAAPANYDAAWVFVKYRVDGGDWHHAELSGAPVMPVGAAGTTASDSKGAFLYHATDFNGLADFDGVELTVQLDGSVMDAAVADLEVKVIGIEMVYVPEGAYYLGSNGGNTGEFHKSDLNLLSNAPYIVADEGTIDFGVGGGELTPGGLLNALFTSETIPAAFPKGYRAFYCMKYETSQRQFTEFFNMLNATGKAAMDISAKGANQTALLAVRNGFNWTGTGDAVTIYPEIPIGGLSANQMMAYLDWCGLRPMSELEYEKAARGPASPVPDEYAWGTDEIQTTDYLITETGTAGEWITNITMGGAIGNALSSANQTMNGPCRIGAFAASGGSTRVDAGASYYGIMELTGNLREFTVSIVDSGDDASAFTGEHGDGSLSAAATANVANWPTGGDGYGTRGGGYTSSNTNLTVSNRSAAKTPFSASPSIGFRGVRTAN